MGLDISYVRGINDNLLVSASFAPGVPQVEPADANFSVAIAAANATSIDITSDIACSLKANDILNFGGGKVMVVTADVDIPAATATPVAVDLAEGNGGEGIRLALDGSETLVFDQLHRVLGTESAIFTTNDNQSNLQSITYDSAYKISWDTVEILSKGWQIPRVGRFKPDSFAGQTILDASLAGLPVWCKVEYPREDGSTVLSLEGLASIGAHTMPNAAPEKVDDTYTFFGKGIPKLVRFP